MSIMFGVDRTGVWLRHSQLFLKAHLFLFSLYAAQEVLEINDFLEI